MNQEELQHLSVNELVTLVLQLQNMNERLLNDKDQEYMQSELDETEQKEEPTFSRVPQQEPVQEDHLNLDEQLQRASLLLQLSIEFRETLDPPVIVERMLHVMASNLGISNASVVLIALDGSVDLAMSLRDGKSQQVTSLVSRSVLDRGLAGWALRHGRSVVLPDVSRDKRWIPYSEWQRDGSAIVLPIRQAQTTLGVMTIFHPQTNHFASRDMLLMEGVAAQAGVAIGAARRYIEESRRREQALSLFAMSQFLTTERSFDDLATMLQEKSVAIFGVDYGLLFLSKDPAVPSPQTLAPVMLPPAMQQPVYKPLVRQATMAVRKACEQRTIIMEEESPDVPGRTVMALPLVHNGNCMGAVALVQKHATQRMNFSANMWTLITTFTNVIAAVCVNMRLVSEARDYPHKLEAELRSRTHQVQHSRDLLRVIFDNMPEGFVLLDSQEVILAANNAFCYPVIGRHPRMIVGQNMSEMWEELEQRSDLQVEMRSTTSFHLPGKDASAMRVLCATSIGQKRWYEVSRLSVLGDDDDIEYYIERWVDITRQQELERHLIAQDQRNILGHLTARVIHDIQTPLEEIETHLTTCSTHTQMLSDTSKEHLTLAQGALNHIDRTLKNLGHLYQTPSTNWECIDMNALLHELEELTAQQFTHYQVSLRFALDDQIPLIYAQKDALRQVFLGLLFNAQEAMPTGGTITITSFWDKGEQGALAPLCRVSIRDTGVGMTTEEIADLFEPFQSTKQQGVGMGLYLSKQIIEQHTGRIEISSAKGEGTTVDIFLPWHERCRDSATR
jgi:PAS domain S-box-containing protein